MTIHPSLGFFCSILLIFPDIGVIISLDSDRNGRSDSTFIMTGPSRVVNTRNGAIIGSTWKLASTTSSHTWHKKGIGGGEPLVEQFLGIPYASRPSIRFMPPGSPVKWRGLYNATQAGPICPQSIYRQSWDTNGDKNLTSNFKDKIAGEQEGDDDTWQYGGWKWRASQMSKYHQSEDCLHLNLYSPVGSDRLSKVPIIVYVILESYDWGSGNLYDGKIVATRGTIIAVTLNIRLGIFGFLATGDSASRGNYGFLDLCAALQWIQENIGFFGGDPLQVTVLGYGYGAVLTNLLMTSPVASGKFRRIILIDGSMYSSLALGTHQKSLYYALASALKCSTSLTKTALNSSQAMLQCLRSVYPVELLEAISNLCLNLTQVSTNGPTFGPYIDQFVLPNMHSKLLLRPFAHSNGPHIEPTYDLMAGLTSGCNGDQRNGSLNLDVDLYGIDIIKNINFTQNMTRRSWGKTIKSLVLNQFRFHRRQIYASIANEYTDWALSNVNHKNYEISLKQVFKDYYVTAPMIKFVRHYSNRRGSGHTYLWTMDLKASITSEGFKIDKSINASQINANITYCSINEDHFPYLLLGYPLMTKSGSLATILSSNKASIYHSNASMNIVENFVKYGVMNEKNAEEYTSPVNGVTGKLNHNLMESIKKHSYPTYDSVNQSYLDIKYNNTKLKSHYKAKRMALWNQLIPILHSPNAVAQTLRYNGPNSQYISTSRSQPIRAAYNEYHSDQDSSLDLLDLNDDNELHYYSDIDPINSEDSKVLFPPPPPAPPTLMPPEVLAKLSRLRGTGPNNKKIPYQLDSKIADQQFNILEWDNRYINKQNTGRDALSIAYHNVEDMDDLSRIFERNASINYKQYTNGKDRESDASTIRPRTFRYISYTSALVITVGVGCGLLFINLVVLAAVYHQRLKQRQYRLHRKSSLMPITSSLNHNGLMATSERDQIGSNGPDHNEIGSYRCKQIRSEDSQRTEFDCCCMVISCASLPGGICSYCNTDCDTAFTVARNGDHRSDTYQCADKTLKDTCKKRKGHSRGFKSLKSSNKDITWDNGHDGINTSNSKDSLQLLNHNNNNNINKKDRRARKKRFNFKQRSTCLNKLKDPEFNANDKNVDLSDKAKITHTLRDNDIKKDEENNLSEQLNSYCAKDDTLYKNSLAKRFNIKPSTSSSICDRQHNYNIENNIYGEKTILNKCPNNNDINIQPKNILNVANCIARSCTNFSPCQCNNGIDSKSSLANSFLINPGAYNLGTTYDNCAPINTLSSSFKEMLYLNVNLPQNCNSMNSILEQQEYPAVISSNCFPGKNSFKKYPHNFNYSTIKDIKKCEGHVKDYSLLNAHSKIERYTSSVLDQTPLPLVTKNAVTSESGNQMKRHNRHLSLNYRLSNNFELQDNRHKLYASSHSSSSSCAMPDVNSIPDNQIPPPPDTPAGRMDLSPVLTYQNKIIPCSGSEDSIYDNPHYKMFGFHQKHNGPMLKQTAKEGNTIPLLSFPDNHKSGKCSNWNKGVKQNLPAKYSECQKNILPTNASTACQYIRPTKNDSNDMPPSSEMPLLTDCDSSRHSTNYSNKDSLEVSGTLSTHQSQFAQGVLYNEANDNKGTAETYENNQPKKNSNTHNIHEVQV